jgi:predicted aspartyl protease
MKITYRNNLPLVTIKVLGQRKRDIEAHIDFAASRTTIPAHIAEELELQRGVEATVATAGGVVSMPEYKAVIEAFGRRHDVLVGGIDLPEESPIRALIGRDILDNYKVCLNGKTKEIEVSDP